MDLKRILEPTHGIKNLTIFLSSVIVLLFFCISTFFVSASTPERILTWSIIAFANIAGSVLGTAISPYSEVEDRRFIRYAGLASALITGYFVSKLEAQVEFWIARSNDIDIPSVYYFRAIGFITVFLASAKATFVYRSYPGVGD